MWEYFSWYDRDDKSNPVPYPVHRHSRMNDTKGEILQYMETSKLN